MSHTKTRKKTESPGILVTGGAGFIGSHLVDELLGRGYNVVALDNLRNGSMSNLECAVEHSNFKFIKGDILNNKDCLKSTENVDIVYHLACLCLRHSIHSPIENHRVNAEGTLNLLKASLKNNIKEFFYISSSEIYGGVGSFPITEDALPRPYTIYGASKLAGEYYCNSFNRCYGLDTTILRLFNNYGPRAHYEGDAGEVIPRAIVNILYNKQPVIFGDGKNTRDFLYVKDAVSALSNLVNKPGPGGIILNIGMGVEITIEGLIKKILTLMNKETLGIKYLESRPADVPRLWVDASRFYKLAKFRPKYSIENGLLETIGYYKKLSRGRDLFSQIKLKNWENN